MKLSQLTSLMLFCLFALLSCQKNEDPEELKFTKTTTVTVDPTPNVPRLLYPNEDEISIEEEAFSWELDSLEEVNIVIRQTSNYFILVDTILNEGPLSIDDIFRPNTEYFWTVKTSTAETSASFTTQDKVNMSYVGQYELRARRFCVGSGTDPCDTTFLAQVEIERNGEEVIIREPVSKIDESYSLDSRGCIDNDCILYRNDGSPASLVAFFYKNDSVYIDYGAWTRWQFKGKLQ